MDLALAIRNNYLYVNCTDAITEKVIDTDVIKVKARLAQLAISRALKNKKDNQSVTPAMKDGEILIDVKNKEISL